MALYPLEFLMISAHTEKKLLQASVVLACIVPLSAGLAGALDGAALLGHANINLDSHFRYLSGLLLGIGIGFISLVPHIERHTFTFRILTLIVFIGGLARLGGFFLAGTPNSAMQAAVVMEVIVAPLLCLWQHRVAAQLSLL